MGIEKQTWSEGYFKLVCALLNYWSEHEITEERKQEAQSALDGVIKYSTVVNRNDEDKDEDGGCIRVTGTVKRLLYIEKVLGRYQVGYPDITDLDVTVDYVSMSEAETQKWKQEKKERQEAHAKYLAELKEAERMAKAKAKEEALQQDLQKIRDYMNDRPNVTIVKARMARELNMSYNRCLELCKLLFRLFVFLMIVYGL